MATLNEHGRDLQAFLNDHFDRAMRKSCEVNQADLDKPMSEETKAAILRENLASENDPYGDGNQDPVPDPSIKGEEADAISDPLRNAHSTGLDAKYAVFEEGAQFHLACSNGNIVEVNAAIDKARHAVHAGHTDALMHLLEKRISLMRFTPLMHCCQGARLVAPGTVPSETSKLCFVDVAEALLAAGARVDARDIAGYTALAIAAGYIASPQSLEIVPVLVKYGANANLRNRFWESYLFHPLWANRPAAFRALLMAGADVTLPDRNGLTARSMAQKSPRLVQVMTEVQRALMLQNLECDHCSKKGVDKFCSACRRTYYCSRQCQTKAWKSGHKDACGKDGAPGTFLDIIVDSMTTRDPLPGIRTPTVQFTNSITGATSRRRMKPKELNQALVVKASRAIEMDGVVGALKINVKNSDFLLVKNRGEGKAAHAKLSEVIEEEGIDVGKVYLSAKWLTPRAAPGSNKKNKKSNVLRLDITKGLPPPKPLW